MRRVEIKSEGRTEVTWGKEGKAEGMIGNVIVMTFWYVYRNGLKLFELFFHFIFFWD